MTNRPEVLVFDVNETLSDVAHLQWEFTAIGAPAQLATAWFAATLRDGFALTSAGGNAPFADIALDVLRAMLEHRSGLTASPDEAVSAIMAAFTRLPVHPDVPEGLRQLASMGFRMVTLSNGSASIADDLLRCAGTRDALEQLLSVEAVGVWKPARRAYLYAAEQTGCAPGELMLVAAHPWDIDGAARAGLRTAYVDRLGAPYPRVFTAPDIVVTDLVALAGQFG